MTVNRRQALSLLGPGLAAPAIGRATAAAAFRHGVASGDPAQDGAVIWTRATPVDRGAPDVPLTWRVATAPDGDPVRSGRASARSARDHTAKLEVTGLQPGRDHWYQFETENGARSPVGRFRTLPIGRTPDLVLAVASCSLWSGGFFNAYRAIAELDRLDAVVHLGDYIYEYGADGYGGAIGQRIGRIPDPPRETLTLADYRRRHAQAKGDPDLQAAHARAAFIPVWDDHEVANDDWTGGAENHDAGEGSWPARKAAAMQAWFEWMPIRDPRPGRPWERINRAFDFGDLATLAMVETRLLARSRQVASKGEVASPAEYAAILSQRADPKREMLGPDQQRWLEDALARSRRSGRPWQLLGNQVVMARVNGPDLERQLSPERYAAMVAKLPEPYRSRIPAAVAGYRAGLPFNLDGWDGYPPARERLYQSFARAGVRPLVLSGDSHAAWANELRDAGGRLAAVEFGATAVTSPSYGDVVPGVGRAIQAASPEVRWCDQDGKGFLHLTLTRDRATADFRTVSTVLSRDYTTRTAARWAARAGAPGLERLA